MYSLNVVRAEVRPICLELDLTTATLPATTSSAPTPRPPVPCFPTPPRSVRITGLLTTSLNTRQHQMSLLRVARS